MRCKGGKSSAAHRAEAHEEKGEKGGKRERRISFCRRKIGGNSDLITTELRRDREKGSAVSSSPEGGSEGVSYREGGKAGTCSIVPSKGKRQDFRVAGQYFNLLKRGRGRRRRNRVSSSIVARGGSKGFSLSFLVGERRRGGKEGARAFFPQGKSRAGEEDEEEERGKGESLYSLPRRSKEGKLPRIFSYILLLTVAVCSEKGKRGEGEKVSFLFSRKRGVSGRKIRPPSRLPKKDGRGEERKKGKKKEAKSLLSPVGCCQRYGLETFSSLFPARALEGRATLEVEKKKRKEKELLVEI